MLDVSDGLAMLPLAAQAERLSGRAATPVDGEAVELF